jgi:hypothetical protein
LQIIEEENESDNYLSYRDLSKSNGVELSLEVCSSEYNIDLEQAIDKSHVDQQA